MNHYEVLGVGHLAGVAEIRTAYLQRALELHPDKSSGNKTAFQNLVAAFEVLSDANRRSEYNQLILKSCLLPARPSFSAGCHHPCGRTSVKSSCCGPQVTKSSCFFDTSGQQASRWYRGYCKMRFRRYVC
mmetsp:Transcript_81293/g.161365  ORF Transcript_81293/g.161365 Transcript_81293/m.161365 type:complete len:130 (-) Transcript_81293:1261-1650(-)